MGDVLKLSKDKRHRSSSSIVAPLTEGTRSERKLDIRASIPEVDDQFALAEARCDDLQEKIDVVRNLKRKRKLKKRSMTRVNDPPPFEKVPFISVRAQPKKKVQQQPSSRLRRLDPPPNPTRGYLDPTIVEQHTMLGNVRGFNQQYKPHQKPFEDKLHSDQPTTIRSRVRRARADGDSVAGTVRSSKAASLEVACGEDEASTNYSDNEMFDNGKQKKISSISINKKVQQTGLRQMANMFANRRRHVPRELYQKDGDKFVESQQPTTIPPRRQQLQRQATQIEERPVVEIFSKTRSLHTPDVKRSVADKSKIVQEADEEIEEEESTLEKKTKEHRNPRRVKYRSRRYEQPTVASQMKQSNTRYYYDNSHHNTIPFIITKSTAPSHNIGVNIQQVLNGLKIQQPLSGIPLTIAHHMGLGHIPIYETKNVQPMLDNREINAIRLGRRLLRLPSYKYISYNRMLQLYREGDGMVPRFLRSLGRPHCFYTSMYNLVTREDFEGVTKNRSHKEAKQSLAEYASLYRTYEQVDKCLKEKHDPELARRKAELARELSVREEQIRQVVQDYRTLPEAETPLRATASTAEDGYRFSSFKLNLSDSQQ